METELYLYRPERPSLLSRARKKIINYWQNPSRKFKIPHFIAAGLILILISAVFRYLPTYLEKKPASPRLLPGLKRDEIETTPPDESGDFIKLTVPEKEAPFFSLKPAEASKFGILPQETFILKTEKPLDEQFITQNLETTRPVKVTSQGNQEFHLTPESSLGTDQVFKIRLLVIDKAFGGYKFDRDYSWAYQTQGKFRVISHLPGDQKTKVPLNTGIDLVFSQDDYQDPKPYIRIEPSIAYRLERHAETLAIVPEKPLTPKTIYTVTLNKGLDLKSRRDPIDKDLTFSFQTDEEATKPVRLSLNKNFTQISPQEPLLTKVFAFNWSDDKTVKAKIYQFPSSQEFLDSREKIDQIFSGWFSYYPEEEVVDTANLSLIAQVELKLQERENVNYLQLPDPLSAGFYLVQFWHDNDKKLEQLWLQSTYLAGYVSVGKKQTVVWANNLESGEPANQARVRVVDTDYESLTNEQGIAVFDSSQIFFKPSSHYLEITSQEQEKLILPVTSLENNSPPDQETKDDYWSYLYQERSLYKPDDTVYFWGVVKNRNSHQPPPLAKIILSASRYSENSVQITEVVTPQPDGSFIGRFSLSGAPNGWYELILKVNDVEVDQSGFRVEDYTKPEMKIEVTAEKKAIFADEKVEFRAQVKFFDETPASQISLKVHEEMTGKSTEITANKYGEIKYLYQPKYQDAYGYPRYESLTIAPALAQQGAVEGHGSVWVYGSRLMITTETKQESNQAFFKATINHIDLENINSGVSSEIKGGPAVNQEASLKITKTWWERVEKGTYYDFIEKTTRPAWEYVRHNETVADKELKTNDQGEISYQFNLEEGKSYEAKITVHDEDKRPASRSDYFYYYQGYEGQESAQKAIPQLNLTKEENTFSVGEAVELGISLDNEDYPDTEKNRFLFVIAQRGRQEAMVQSQPKLSFPFEAKHIPNTYVGAIAFTGRFYQVVSSPCRWQWSCYYYSSYYRDYSFNGLEISYQKEDNQLDLSIEASQKVYQPSDQATVTIRVSKEQQSLSNAQVNLVLVDEAMAAIGGVYEPDIIPSLYQSVPSQIYFSYHSHQPLFPMESMAEMGGGGGGPREIFKDTAFFGQSKTDEQGQAVFNFQLPDNITTWLVYAQAVTENLQAGQKEGKLIVSQEFFVTSHFPKEFLEKDRPFLTASSFGRKLREDAKVDYQAIFYEGDQEKEKKDQWGMAFKTVDFSFPSFLEGENKVSLTGKAPSLEDGITLPFKIKKTRFSFNQHQTNQLKAGQELTSLGISQFLSGKPVRLIISDLGKGKYYYQLMNFCYLSSNRLEKKLAKKAAGEILKESFDEKSCLVSQEELAKFQNLDGGLSQVWWGGSHLETTAWAVFADSQSFDQERLTDYLNNKLNEARAGTIQKIQAAWGLTSLKKPAINHLRLLAGQAVAYQEKVLTGLALATAGETEKAREIYFDILADYAYTFKPYIRIQAESAEGSTPDKFLKDTSLALLLGIMVEPDYNPGLYAYLRDYQGQARDIVLDLGEMAFIEQELNKLPQEFTQVHFQSALRELSKEITKGRNWVITLEPQERENFVFRVNAGKAEAVVSYFVGPEGFSQLQADKRLEIKRTYRKAKGESQKILPGDIVEVKLEFDLDKKESPRGAYTITDFLPSGLTYLANPGAYGFKTSGWVSQGERNVIEHTFYNSPWWRIHGHRTFVYYTRASAVGTYIAEPAVIQSQLDPSVFGRTPGETIKIESPSTEES